MKTKLHLVYDGGSGGFFALHLLLLTDKFFCAFHNTNLPKNRHEFSCQFDKIITEQWNISQPHLWKNKEHWPGNNSTQTLDLSGLTALFFSCNKLWDDRNQAQRILIYTDIDLQLKLARFKSANYFAYTLQNKQEKLEIEWQRRYSMVKDPSWPQVKVSEIRTLPNHVLYELEHCHNISLRDIIDCYYCNGDIQEYDFRRHAAYIGNTPVMPNVKKLQERCHHLVRLQDIVRSKGTVLTDLLQVPYNQKLEQFVANWVALHPVELQKQICTT